jgi:acyl dehydratase
MDRSDRKRAVIDDDVLASMREFVGQRLVVGQYNDQASHDVIKHYAWGIGDLNPLWLDDGYAAGTRFATRIAPPTILFSFCDGVAARGLPDGVRPVQAQSRIVIGRPSGSERSRC